MSRRSGQSGTIVVAGRWYRVRWREDVEGQDQRLQRSEKIAPVMLDRSGKPKPPSFEVKRKAREIVEHSGANSVERFNRVVLGAQTFRERAEQWLTEVKHVYPVIGDILLPSVNNKTCKPLVSAMFDAGLSVCSVNNYMKAVLQIVRSLKDEESGLPIHNLKWNREYLDLPKINRDEQNVPAFDAEQINKLVADSDGDEQMLYIIEAATGLRIGECLGLEVRHVLNDGRTLHIEQAVNRFGELAGLKTKAARRNVDVTIEVAAYINEFIKDKGGLLFATSNGSPHLVGNLRSRWLQERFPDYGFHSFRRYRVTHLEAVRAHGHLTKVWTGHALSGVTEQYAESLKRNTALRLAEVEKCGTGFVLSAPNAPRISVSEVVAVAA